MKNNRNFLQRFNIIPKLLCVFFAFIIWLYVMAVESPDHEETIYKVPVALTGVANIENSYNLSVFSGYDSTVDITVKGQKSVIKKYTVDDFKVSADVSSFTEGGRYTVKLYFDMPSGITMLSSSDETLNLYIDEKISTTVNVVPHLTSGTIPENCELGELTCDTDTLTISGPRALIEEVNCAAVNVNAGNLSTSVTVVESVTLVNKSGEDMTNPYVKLSKSEVKVTVPVYSYKEVPIKVPCKYGYYNDETASISVRPEKVRIKADPAVLDKTEAVNTTVIDETKILSDSSLVLKLELPDNIMLAESEPESVNVSVVHKGTAVRDMTVKNITVEGADKLDYEILNTYLSVTLRGKKSMLESLKPENVSVIIDLSGYKQTTGILYTPVTVRLPEGAEGVYAIGEYSVQVKIS